MGCSGIWQFGETPWYVEDIKVAVNNCNGTFGSLRDVKGANMIRLTTQAKSSTREGDGYDVAKASRIRGAQVVFSSVGVVAAAFEIVSGIVADGYGTQPYRMKQITAEVGHSYPYFAIGGRIVAANGDNSGALVMLPMCKVMGDLQWEFGQDEIVMPEFTAELSGDPVLVGRNGKPMLWDYRTYEDLPALAFPLPNVP